MSPGANETISALQPLKSDPNFRQIRVSDRRIATLSAAAIEKLGLSVGQRWTDALSQRVATEEAAAKVRKAAMTMLAKRSRSSGELTERLLRRSFDPSIIKIVVAELSADQWIDDQQLARTVAHDLATRQGASTRLIVAKLKHRKISPEMARAAANDATTDDPWHTALALAQKQLTKLKRFSPMTVARRIAGLLGRRGYDPDLIAEVIEHLGLANPGVDD